MYLATFPEYRDEVFEIDVYVYPRNSFTIPRTLEARYWAKPYSYIDIRLFRKSAIDDALPHEFWQHRLPDVVYGDANQHCNPLTDPPNASHCMDDFIWSLMEKNLKEVALANLGRK